MMFIKLTLQNTKSEMIVNARHIIAMYPSSTGTGTVIILPGDNNSVVVAQSMSWIVEVFKAPENALL